jgi:hypothetical protein
MFELQSHYSKCQVECAAQTPHLPVSIRRVSEGPLILIQLIESSKRTNGRGRPNPNIGGVVCSIICNWLVHASTSREVTGAGLVMRKDVQSINLSAMLSKSRLDESKSRISPKD